MSATPMTIAPISDHFTPNRFKIRSHLDAILIFVKRWGGGEGVRCANKSSAKRAITAAKRVTNKAAQLHRASLLSSKQAHTSN